MAAVPSSKPSVPVHIVEDHDAALPAIYRAIGAKKLPFTGTGLIHFDAHPDLLSPNILANECSDKEKLFAYTSIAEWILPAVYMGHISHMVWLKPPWCSQITDGVYQLHVGRDTTTGYIRLGTPLPYFISELLYVPQDNLTGMRTIPLQVATVAPITQNETVASSNKPLNSVTDGKDGTSLSECCIPPSKKPKMDEPVSDTQTAESSQELPRPILRETSRLKEQLSDVVSNCSAWILDIDLDFFSTGNPFTTMFNERQYQYLRELYQMAEPENASCSQSIAERVQNRQLQLDSLKALWSQSEESSESVLCKEIKSLIGTVQDGAVVKPEDIHLAGAMTDLPEHFSSQEEVVSLIRAARHLLKSCKEPSMITIARSTVDEYTPPSQVENIQDLVLGELKELYGSLEEKFHYLESVYTHTKYEI